MNEIKRHITGLPMLLAMAVVMLLGSCASEAEMPDAPEEARYVMGLYVDLGGVEAPRGTRSELPEGPGYESGTGFENYIAVGDLQVYLFSTDNKLIARLTGEDMKETTEFQILPFTEDKTTNTVTYRIQFRVDKILDDVMTRLQSFKIVMLANWGAYPAPGLLVPGKTTIDDLTRNARAIAEFTGRPLSADNRMPFYGVQEYRDVQFADKQVTTHKSRLILLRALAKIDVYDHEETSRKIESVTLTRYNSKFYCAPLGVFHNDDYTNYGYDFDFVPRLSLPADNPFAWEVGEPLKLTKNSDGHFVAYVPEYQNVGRDSDRARLLVRYADGQVHEVDFKYYNNPPAGSQEGDPFDLRRNYWYKFRIKRGESEVIISADVLPYKEITLEPEFGLPDPPEPEPEEPETEEETDNN